MRKTARQVDHVHLKHCTLTSNVKTGDLARYSLERAIVTGCDAAKLLHLPISCSPRLHAQSFSMTAICAGGCLAGVGRRSRHRHPSGIRVPGGFPVEI
jgi:hypothetical protein